MIVIIDYGLGNLSSILNMLEKIGAAAMISSDLGDIRSAEKLILPGVGAFDQGIYNLSERDMVGLLNERVIVGKVPILGICLGQQLFSTSSEEGMQRGLGWLDATCLRIPGSAVLKVPHMGWNMVSVRYRHSLFAGLEDANRFYFVHSYYMECANPQDVLGETTYGESFASAIAKNNIFGVQFHPEKSHRFGLRLLQNFAEL